MSASKTWYERTTFIGTRMNNDNRKRRRRLLIVRATNIDSVALYIYTHSRVSSAHSSAAPRLVAAARRRLDQRRPEREFRRLTSQGESTDALATRHIAIGHTRASVVVIARRPSMRSRVESAHSRSLPPPTMRTTTTTTTVNLTMLMTPTKRARSQQESPAMIPRVRHHPKKILMMTQRRT